MTIVLADDLEIAMVNRPGQSRRTRCWFGGRDLLFS